MREIAEYDDVYIHRGKQAFDTGLELNLLQEYVLVSLDIFNEIKQNESINNKLEAWLTFLGTDSPELIVKLISSNPEFVPLYNDMYELCLNTEKVMGMFSKELAELDRNTVDYMVDQMQQEIDAQKDIISEKDRALDEKDRALDEKDKALDEKDNIIDELRNRILELENGNR